METWSSSWMKVVKQFVDWCGIYLTSLFASSLWVGLLEQFVD